MKRFVIAASLAAAAMGTAHATNFGGANGDFSDYPNLTRYGDAYAYATTRTYSYQNFPEYHAANGMATGTRSAARTGDPVNPGGSSTQRLSETTGPASTLNSPQNGHMVPAPGYDSRGNPVRTGQTDLNSTSGASSAAGTGAGAAAAGASSTGSRSSMGSGSSRMGDPVNPGGSSTQRQTETVGPASTMNSPQNGHMIPAPSHSDSRSGLSSGSSAAGTGAGAAASGASSLGSGSSMSGSSMGTGSSMSSGSSRTGDPVNPGGSATQRQTETTGPASTLNSPQNGHMTPAPSHSGSPSGLSSGSSAAGTGAGAAGAVGGSGTMQQRDMTTTTPGSTLPADPTVRGTPGDRPVTGR